MTKLFEEDIRIAQLEAEASKPKLTSVPKTIIRAKAPKPSPKPRIKKPPAPRKETQRKHYQKNREKILAAARIKRRMWGLKYHWLTIDDFNALLAQQNFCCAICHSETADVKHKRDWCLDHSHRSNRARGLLCFRCNTMLGFARDNPIILTLAAAYLSKWNALDEV